MSDAIRLYHPMVTRAANSYRRSKTYDVDIARQLSWLIGPLPTTSQREQELRNIYVAAQFSILPKKYTPAIQELSLQVVRLLGGITQLRVMHEVGK